MIRRTFDLDGRQLIVTYDPDTDTMNVGHRAASYDEWSRPIPLIENDDDPVGRKGGPGAQRGAPDLAAQLRAIADELTATVHERQHYAPTDGAPDWGADRRNDYRSQAQGAGNVMTTDYDRWLANDEQFDYGPHFDEYDVECNPDAETPTKKARRKTT